MSVRVLVLRKIDRFQWEAPSETGAAHDVDSTCLPDSQRRGVIPTINEVLKPTNVVWLPAPAQAALYRPFGHMTVKVYLGYLGSFLWRSLGH